MDITKPLPLTGQLIGLSLSYCVRDILRGAVQLDQVRFISAGTCARTEEAWREVITTYRLSYWKKFPQKDVVELLATLFTTGRILQPRLEGRAPARWNAQPWCKPEDYNVLMREAENRRRSAVLERVMKVRDADTF